LAFQKRVRLSLNTINININLIKTIGSPTFIVGFFRFACQARKPQILAR